MPLQSVYLLVHTALCVCLLLRSQKLEVSAEEADAATESVCHTIRGLKALHSDLRASVDRRSITLRKKGRLLDRLQEEFAPEEGLIRQYLKSVYETDRDLVEKLEVAKQQVRPDISRIHQATSCSSVAPWPSVNGHGTYHRSWVIESFSRSGVLRRASPHL
jgi:hypothetical protein